MRKNFKFFLIISSLILVSIVSIKILKNDNDIQILNPYPRSLYPPEFSAPTFEWTSKTGYQGLWKLKITSNKQIIYRLRTAETKWQPDSLVWEAIKKHSSAFTFEIQKENSWIKKKKIDCYFSTDSVGSPILFRQMPIPFVLAEKVLDSMSYKIINVGTYSKPNCVMKGFQVCGNCHSFSSDGKTIGLDLDAGRRDKGGYFIVDLQDTVVFNHQNYLSWSKLEKRKTFGFLSRLSPDGRYVLTTVKDRVISKNFDFEPQHIAFSQLFFPVNGHLAVYDRKTKILRELQGANSDEFVQTNGVWSPDGKIIYFARAKSLNFDEQVLNIKDEQLIEEFVNRKKTFKYNICSIPFNQGKGGKAIPVKGASENGMSNYFPVISPDGKWMIFCQAENFMLLQPDSKLFIVSLSNGKVKKLDCNLPLMNSWHAWSPNGKWIVFVSKTQSIYTDMFLSHIDNQGNSSAPILLEKAREFRKVANYPEFLTKSPNYKFTMNYKFIEIVHIQNAIENSNAIEAERLLNEFKNQGQYIFEEDSLQLENIKKEIEKIK